MEYKIIHTENYLLVVDDSEIKVGNYYLHTQINKIFDCNQNNNYLVLDRDYLKKIISHLPLNNSPILERVDLLPDLEDVEQLADNMGFYDSTEDNKGNRTTKAFISGYNKAKEKFAYTEEDLRKAFKSGQKYGEDNSCNAEIHLNLNETQYIQSLQQPKLPIAFDFIDKIYKVKSGTIQEHKDGVAGYEYYEWVGTYKY